MTCAVIIWWWAYFSWLFDALESEESLKQRWEKTAEQVGDLIGHKTVWTAEKRWCQFITDAKDNDHCIQDAALRSNNPDRCDEIKAASFTEKEWPAPRDKCYMLIAGQTGDDSFCNRIVWGMISYTQEQCYKAAADFRASAWRWEWNEEETEEIEITWECKRDNECPIICEGNVMRKQWCNGRSNSCEKTFDTDCSTQKTTIQVNGETFSSDNICLPEVWCVEDSKWLQQAVQNRKDSLMDERKGLQATYQHYNTVYLRAADLCLQELSDVTNKLIIDSAFMLQSPPTKLIDVVWMEAWATMDLIIGAWSTPSEEIIAEWCTLERVIKNTDLPLIEKKQNQLKEQIESLDKIL